MVTLKKYEPAYWIDKLLDALQNPAQRFLAFGGAALVVIGGVIAAVANNAAQDARNANDLLTMLGGLEYLDFDAGSEFQGWIIFGIALAVLGVVMIVALIVVKAGQKSQQA
ncbi:hypothetical protein N1027_10650 [Herbiconiux sp. CPCC 205763]|uniref:Uncharacterized protein n=1 Tax=Herbiconiux aconitum TaxID=2970913 RepID=A0ABT2GSP8_9MICO|nr:hypothetical protein [Herbiconiux aconitum]MCS5718592.1 hypothetical protein [Herbiconiux aconitum]